MGAGFKFDGQDFEKQVMKAAESGVRDLSNQYEHMFDSLRRRYTGRPVGEINLVLQREWRRVNGGNITDPELTHYATLISGGTRIKMNVKM